MRYEEGDPGDEQMRRCVICGGELSDDDGLICLDCQEDMREEMES